MTIDIVLKILQYFFLSGNCHEISASESGVWENGRKCALRYYLLEQNGCRYAWRAVVGVSFLGNKIVNKFGADQVESDKIWRNIRV